jgi:hypothetical protein
MNESFRPPADQINKNNEPEPVMHEFSMFIMRVCLGGVFAYIIARFFRPEADLGFIAGMTAFLVIMAYLLEYLRMRKK